MNSFPESDEFIDSPRPAISIGLPVYNGENYLRECLDSLLNQTLRDFELIVSDNASTDTTAEILNEYQQRDSRIRYFRQGVNIGPSGNFLFVLREARGDLFMWAAHDDVWADNWLEVLTANLTQDDAGIRGKILLVRDGAVVGEKHPPNLLHRGYIRCFMGNENNYRSHYVYSLFHRKNLLALSPGVFSLDYYPDAIFTYAMLRHGSLRTLPHTYMRYRLHDENCGIAYSARWKGWRKILYRIHPLRYYCYYLRYTEDPRVRLTIAAMIPLKHLYAQTSFWVRGLREIVTGLKTL